MDQPSGGQKNRKKIEESPSESHLGCKRRKKKPRRKENWGIKADDSMGLVPTDEAVQREYELGHDAKEERATGIKRSGKEENTCALLEQPNDQTDARRWGTETGSGRGRGRTP